MAFALDQHVRSAQSFLVSCKALPNFAALQKKQFDTIMTKVDAMKSLSTHLVPGLMQAISCLNLQKQQLITLQSKLAEKATAEDTGAHKKVRRSMQDHTKLAHFLDQGMWAQVMRLQKGCFAKREVLCQMLCKHMAKLSLECPSEPTVGWLVALLFHTEWNMDEPNSTEMYDTFTVWKPIVKRYLKKFKVPGVPFLASLPDQPEMLPAEIFELAFGERPGFVMFSAGFV